MVEGAFTKENTIPTKPSAISTKENVFNLLENVYISMIFKNEFYFNSDFNFRT